MPSWVVGAIANGVVAIAYFLISAAIALPLMRSRQLRENLLGTATAAIFLTCAVHHGSHTVHMLMPYFDLAESRGLAMRASYDWTMAGWDVVGAAVGVYYWSLRRRAEPDRRHGPRLFDDLRQREHDAVALNDDVLQGLVVAKMALEMDDPTRAMAALDTSIAAASAMVSDLLGSAPAGVGLRRAGPASLEER